MSKSKSTTSSSEEYIVLHKISIRNTLIASAIYLLTLLAIRWKAITGLTTYYLGGSHSDAGLYYWLFRHHLRFFFSDGFFQTTAFFPYPNTLAWSDNFLFPALLAMPFAKLGIPEDALYNLILLLVHFLLGYCTFRTVHLVTGNIKSITVCRIRCRCNRLDNIIARPPATSVRFLFSTCS